jgi:hypothetical protein
MLIRRLQIEGTQASLIDILEHEAEADESSETLDVKLVRRFTTYRTLSPKQNV